MKLPILLQPPLSFPCFLLLLTSILLGGCFQARPIALYTLNIDTTLQPLTPSPPATPVVIGPVTLTGYLDQPRMILRRGPARIDAIANHQWAGDLANMIGSKLAGEVGILLKPTPVSLHPEGIRGDNPQRVTIEVLRLEDDGNHHALLEVRWTLLSANSTTGNAPQISRMLEKLPSEDHEELALALNRCLTHFSQELAKALAPSQPLQP